MGPQGKGGKDTTAVSPWGPRALGGSGGAGQAAGGPQSTWLRRLTGLSGVYVTTADGPRLAQGPLQGALASWALSSPGEMSMAVSSGLCTSRGSVWPPVLTPLPGQSWHDYPAWVLAHPASWGTHGRSWGAVSCPGWAHLQLRVSDKLRPVSLAGV